MNETDSTSFLAMSDGYESSSSSEDSFTPVEDLHVCPYDLEPMESSDGEEVEEHVDPVYHFLSVKTISSLSRNKMSRFNPWMEENKLHRYFKALAIKEDDLKMFPMAMRKFLSGEHPKIYESLLKLDNGEFFIYLGKSLVVTLNIENSRVRIPTSLIFDACVFSVNQPVVVISVFQENTNISRMNMYNTFLARGVTEALGSYSRENISVKKGTITDECNVHEAVHKFQKEATEFQNTSFFEMSKSKAENLAEALLRSTAVASTYLVINPKEDPNLIWFLNMEEFQFLMEFIDLVPLSVSHTIESDSNLIALEMVMRLGKLHRTVLLLSSKDANVRDYFKRCKNIKVCEALDERDKSQNILIITDHPMEALDIQNCTRKPGIILVLSSKSDASEKLFDQPQGNPDICKSTEYCHKLIKMSGSQQLEVSGKDLKDCCTEPKKSNIQPHCMLTRAKKRSSEDLKVFEKDTRKKLSYKSRQRPQSLQFKSPRRKPSFSSMHITSSHLTRSDPDESDENV